MPQEKKHPNIWISNILLEHRPPALRPLHYPSHILPVEFQKDFHGKLCAASANFIILEMTVASECFANERKQGTKSQTFCLPGTLCLVLPFFLHFQLGNQFLGKFCGFFKMQYHVLLFITAQDCESRGFIREYRG